MTCRILVVEDESVLRKHLARLLVCQGYEVATAGTCAEALGQLTRAKFDTVLLDVRLPDGDGLDLLAKLGDAERPHTMIVMTAYSSSASEERAEQLGVDHLLRKPLDLPWLLGAVRAGVSRGECEP